MPKMIRIQQRTLIPSSFVIRALTKQGSRYHCGNCGDLMFVRYESGLCPLCYNDRRPFKLQEPVREVPHDLALAGILDDPALEALDAPEAASPPVSD
jgi:hypothetical protein